MTLILIGVGGAAGSILRYLLSTVPSVLPFPLMTLLTNFLGAFLIGIIAGLTERIPSIPDGALSLAKTGFCGGFTTFSTFSLETVTLLEEHRYQAGFLYAFLSLFLCLLGVVIGKSIILRLKLNV